MNRYAAMFDHLTALGEGAFIPFTVLGDPDPDGSLNVIDWLVESGADGLELGVPFSDPIADGPVIQAASARALASGTTPRACLELVHDARQVYPEIPIGLLTYANPVLTHGADAFYSDAAAAGVDSVLIADVPVAEVAPFADAADRHGIDPVLIAPVDADDRTLKAVATRTKGYTYVLGRAGVTGDADLATLAHETLLGRLRELEAPPPVVGFGIGSPEQVQQALRAGAAGVIAGTAIVRRIDDRRDVIEFVTSMKDATRPAANR
jgi:tryptophan synthase alpha chain